MPRRLHMVIDNNGAMMKYYRGQNTLVVNVT
jgi:hypothetical protein